MAGYVRLIAGLLVAAIMAATPLAVRAGTLEVRLPAPDWQAGTGGGLSYFECQSARCGKGALVLWVRHPEFDATEKEVLTDPGVNGRLNEFVLNLRERGFNINKLGKAQILKTADYVAVKVLGYLVLDKTKPRPLAAPFIVEIIFQGRQSLTIISARGLPPTVTANLAEALRHTDLKR